jgi:hypothetical protein
MLRILAELLLQPQLLWLWLPPQTQARHRQQTIRAHAARAKPEKLAEQAFANEVFSRGLKRI